MEFLHYRRRCKWFPIMKQLHFALLKLFLIIYHFFSSHIFNSHECVLRHAAESVEYKLSYLAAIQRVNCKKKKKMENVLTSMFAIHILSPTSSFLWLFALLIKQHYIIPRHLFFAHFFLFTFAHIYFALSFLCVVHIPLDATNNL